MLGILIANLINFGTERMNNTASWRIPMGISILWPITLGIGILFFPETPRHEFRMGRVSTAAKNIGKFYGVDPNHPVVRKQLHEMQSKQELEEEIGSTPLLHVVTGPRMLYRTLLGMVIMALQQLTGANYFFYYGTTVFSSVGLSNSFVTAIILGAVNFVTTFPGLYFVEKFGRRKCLMAGAAWMFVCFLIFASLGKFALVRDDGTNNTSVGYVMIVFACLFIAAFASTWGKSASTQLSNMLTLIRTDGLGSGVRDLPAQIPGPVYGALLSNELDVHFSSGFLHTFHHRSHRIRVRIRVCRVQFGSGLDRLLFPARDFRQKLGAY